MPGTRMALVFLCFAGVKNVRGQKSHSNYKIRGQKWLYLYKAGFKIGFTAHSSAYISNDMFT